MRDAIVITGLGCAGPHGLGRDAAATALAGGHAGAVDIDRSAGFHRAAGARTALLTRGLDLAALVPPGVGRRMSPPSRLAVAAARLALRDAHLGDSALPDLNDDTAVVMGTAFGPSSFTERLLHSILRESPEAASPAIFTECVANAPAAQIAVSCEARGPNITVTQREASALLALERAATLIAEGRATRALAGASDELTPLLHAILDRYGALARAEATGPERARPFDRRRTGFTAADGAAVAVLESSTSAEARGAQPLARIVVQGAAFDPTATATDWGRGHALLGAALRSSLDRAGVDLDSVRAIVSGASGACSGDRVEALTLRHAWAGAPLPPVYAPKAITGEYGGGFLAAALLLVSGAPVAEPGSRFTLDPELGITPAHGSAPAGRTLVTSLAAGGAAAWIVMERV